jgi:phenylacetate-CoA ligase
LPIHERLRGRKTLKYFHRLEQEESESPEALEALQLQKLRRLVRHCVAHVPYYENALQEMGVSTVEELDLKAFSRLPVLEKTPIREKTNSFLARHFAGTLIPYSTGGSTGEPLAFFTDVDKESWHKAHDWRCRSWFGVRPGDRQIDLWGSPIELKKLSLLRRLKDRWLLNHWVLPAFDLREARLEEYCKVVRAFKPRVLYGYPSALTILAQFVNDRPGLLKGYRPRLVACTSEMLYPHQRELIHEALRCPVANEYGSRDGGLIAHECPEGGLHIAAEHVLLEVDAPDSAGVGDLIITNLDGFGMPFLRYRIGDRGSIDERPCACGRALPVMQDLAGRANDLLMGADGVAIHPLAAVYLLRPYRRKLRQFRITQRQDLGLSIELSCLETLDEADLNRIKDGMAEVFRFPIPVSFEIKDYIQPGPSGKHQSVVCQVGNSR